MKKVKVSIIMVEEDTGGFSTGIGKIGIYTKQEFNDKKYNELIKDIPIIDGCCWSYRFEWFIVCE